VDGTSEKEKNIRIVHDVGRPEMQMGLRHCLLHKNKGIYIVRILSKES